MSAEYYCPLPCTRSFSSAVGLSIHRLRSAECSMRYARLLESLASIPNTSGDDADYMEVDNMATEMGNVEQREGSEGWDPIQQLETMEVDDAEDPAQGRSSRRLVEPEADRDDYTVDVHPTAGRILRKEEAPFGQERAYQEMRGEGNVYYPFANEKEWELSAWLHQSGLPLSQMDTFLKLKYVSRTQGNMSFADLSIDPVKTSLLQKCGCTPRPY